MSYSYQFFLSKFHFLFHVSDFVTGVTRFNISCYILHKNQWTGVMQFNQLHKVLRAHMGKSIQFKLLTHKTHMTLN